MDHDTRGSPQNVNLDVKTHPYALMLTVTQTLIGSSRLQLASSDGAFKLDIDRRLWPWLNAGDQALLHIAVTRIALEPIKGPTPLTDLRSLT